MNSIGQLYAIRQKTTGFYIPEPNGRMGRGGSHVEPVDAATSRPRTFVTQLAARNFLSQWLRGKHTISRTKDWETGHWEEDAVEVTPVPTRIKEDMEIILVDLIPQIPS